jgi:hypothetical protein
MTSIIQELTYFGAPSDSGNAALAIRGERRRRSSTIAAVGSPKLLLEVAGSAPPPCTACAPTCNASRTGAGQAC